MVAESSLTFENDEAVREGGWIMVGAAFLE